MTKKEFIAKYEGWFSYTRREELKKEMETDLELVSQALRIHDVVGQSEQLEPYEPDNFPKCVLCKSIHDPEICCQD